ncbi:phosphotriesterase [candidate division KSB1 bacterium]|nr:phosphotriesterase [candidate division KSB1 bacterium]
MKKHIIYAALYLLVGCTPRPSNYVVTVNGRLAASEMGITLPHEHLLVDFIGADSTSTARWDKNDVMDVVLPYLLEIKELGVKTFIDCTPAFLGRDPILLKMLSEKSGIHILTTTGYYGAYHNKFIPRHAINKTAEELAAIWIAEYRDGLEGTGVRPGIIKIAVERDGPLSDVHKKIVTAAALTHLATGLTIVSHTGPESAAYEQIELLQSLGVAPEAFVWTHAHEGSKQAHIDLAQKGVWISLDKVNDDPRTIEEIAGQLKNLKNNNLLDKALVSHDAGWYRPRQPGGGHFRGFTAIFTQLLPKLRENGFSDVDIDKIMIRNPQKAYAVQIRKIIDIK